MKSELEEISKAFSAKYARGIDYRSFAAKATSGTMTAPEVVADTRYIDIIHAIEKLPPIPLAYILYMYTSPSAIVEKELERRVHEILFNYQIDSYCKGAIKTPRSWGNNPFITDKKKTRH